MYLQDLNWSRSSTDFTSQSEPVIGMPESHENHLPPTTESGASLGWQESLWTPLQDGAMRDREGEEKEDDGTPEFPLKRRRLAA
jgi:hypothetical protein